MAIKREMSFGDYVNIIKRRLPLVIGVFLLMFLIALIVALKIPKVYQSDATILIQSQQIQSGDPNAKEKFASERFEALKQVALSNEKLFKIADKYKLYGLDKYPRSAEDVASALRANIKAELLKAEAEAWQGKPTVALQISYSYNKPDETYNVTKDVVNLFLQENDKQGKLRANETAEFYAAEAEKQKVVLLKIENDITKYKQNHANSLPEHRDMQLESIDRLELDLRDTQRQYSSTQAELRALDVSLDSAKAGIGINVGLEQGAGATNSGSVAELTKLKQELENLKGVYSDDHPTVRALKRRINVLENSDEVKLASGSNKPVTAQSIMVAKIQAQIESANAKLKLLEGQESTTRNKMNQIQSRVTQTAQTEGELGSLTRDYDSAKSAYAELKTKQDNAKIANNIEMENKGERFVVSEAPILPERPIKPNRMLLVLAGFFGSLAAALGLAVLLEILDKRIRGVDALATIMKMQPIAMIPFIENAAEQELKKRNFISMLIKVIVGLVVVLVLVQFIMPLGSIMAKLSAKF
ncbi:MAG: Wzz/FepE/Etk N-terminal domain-containing protein [Methylophilaceae bacterium]